VVYVIIPVVGWLVGWLVTYLFGWLVVLISLASQAVTWVGG